MSAEIWDLLARAEQLPPGDPERQRLLDEAERLLSEQK